MRATLGRVIFIAGLFIVGMGFHSMDQIELSASENTSSASGFVDDADGIEKDIVEEYAAMDNPETNIVTHKSDRVVIRRDDGNQERWEILVDTKGKLRFRANNPPKTRVTFDDDNKGRVGIGTINPKVKLHVTGGSDTEKASGGYLVLGSTTGKNVSFDANEIMARNDGAASTLYLNHDGGTVALGAGNKSGRVGIGTDNPKNRLHVVGGLRVTDLDRGNFRNVQWNDATGEFFYDNSSRRHKENIKPLEDDFSALLKVEPKTYTRPGKPNRWEIGYIAEDFHEMGMAKLVQYDTKGRPDGINYEKICLYLTEVVKTQQTQIEWLKTENENTKSVNAQLKGKLTALADRQEALESMFLAMTTTSKGEKRVTYDPEGPDKVHMDVQ